jgi:hypoxanthine phosphoribosyltransferase
VTIEEANRVLEGADLVASEGEIKTAIDRMAEEISGRVDTSRPIACCVMNGGLIFAGQLLTKLAFPLEVDYVHATRYGHETTGARLKWLVRPQVDPSGRTVLLLDDILDEGITLAAIADHYRQLGAGEVLTAVLVDKRHTRKVVPGFRADFTGIETDDRFLFGYGMDNQGYWRNAPRIYAVTQR